MDQNYDEARNKSLFRVQSRCAEAAGADNPARADRAEADHPGAGGSRRYFPWPRSEDRAW